MPPPDDLLGRDVVALRSENLPALLMGHPDYRGWDQYADPDTPGVIVLASPKAASA